MARAKRKVDVPAALPAPRRTKAEWIRELRESLRAYYGIECGRLETYVQRQQVGLSAIMGRLAMPDDLELVARATRELDGPLAIGEDACYSAGRLRVTARILGRLDAIIGLSPREIVAGLLEFNRRECIRDRCPLRGSGNPFYRAVEDCLGAGRRDAYDDLEQMLVAAADAVADAPD